MAEETPGRLEGLVIALTREEPGELAKQLAEQGARVLHFPLIRVVGADDFVVTGAYDWLVFTSVNGVRFAGGQTLFSASRKQGLTPSVACVGDVTAEEARRAGYSVDLVPERQHVKGLIEAFAALEHRTGRVLYPRSELAASTLKEGLKALGFTVDDPVAYRTLPDENGQKALAAQMGLQAIVFASPSAVRSAVEAIGNKLKQLRIYSIGPTTSHAVREAGFEVAGEAAEHSTPGLLQAILDKEARS